MIYKTENNLKSIIMKRLFLAVAALAALVSCNRGNELVPSQNFRNVSIVAKSAETKTVLQDNAVVWEESDAIKVRFDKTDASASHFETFTTAQGGETASFAGTLPNDVSQTGGYDATGYAVYPADAMAADGTISFTLPSDVTVDATGTFSASENLSSAKVSLTELVSNGTTSANFLNAFSIIRFTLDPDVKTLKLTADKPLAGAAVMEFDDNGRLVVNSFTSEADGKELTISAPEGGFVENAMYNVLVFPGTSMSLTAAMTDADNCTFEKTVDNLTFAAAKFYEFNFTNPDNFDKLYSFTATGRDFADDDQIQVVVSETPSANAVLTYADNKFSGKTTHANYEADKPGYALYPASAYNSGNISYTLPADGTQPTGELYAAPFSLKDESVTFTSVTSSLAQLSFTVPTGIKSVKIASDKGIVGTASMTVTDGVLVAGAGDGKDINVTTGTYTLYVYPVEAATLTVTLTDAANDTVEKGMTLTVAAGETKTLDLSGDLNFDKNGNFTHEGFENGNGEDAIEF